MTLYGRSHCSEAVCHFGAPAHVFMYPAYLPKAQWCRDVCGILPDQLSWHANLRPCAAGVMAHSTVALA